MGQQPETTRLLKIKLPTRYHRTQALLQHGTGVIFLCVANRRWVPVMNSCTALILTAALTM